MKSTTSTRRLFILILGFILLGSGYYLLPLVFTKTPSSITENSNLSQTLPITATVVLGGETINLEVAKTRQQRALGLMYRTSLADDRGMLFPYDPPRLVSFWMKNCFISLDLIFIRNGAIRAIIFDVPPCTAEPCPTYGSDVPVDAVIELRAGRAVELGLKVGDRPEIQFLESDVR